MFLDAKYQTVLKNASDDAGSRNAQAKKEAKTARRASRQKEVAETQM